MTDYPTAPTPMEKACRACGGTLDSVLHLGNLYPSRFPQPCEPLPARVPLDCCCCRDCKLVQLRHTVPPDEMFREYWYRSSINELMRAELADIVAKALQLVGPLDYADLVVDVGANDGTLLQEYRKHDREIVRVAFEPATNLQSELTQHAEVVIPDYFPSATPQLKGLTGRVKVLTSIAMFYDLDEPKRFVAAVADALHEQGVWIVQFQDLAQMMKATAFDNLCFEHLCYYSLASFERLLEGTGLRVVRAERREINGGSYRLYVQHAGPAPRDPSVAELRQWEAGCDSWQALETFAWRVGEARRQIHAAIATVREEGGTIDLYGASTKANTLLQYCGLDETVIRQAIERSPEKVGRRTITNIPIVSEETARQDPATVWLIGIWQFRPQILAREAAYLEGGGTLLFPLPVVDLVQRSFL